MSERKRGVEFSPDGSYVPRIFIIDKTTGKVRHDLFNENGDPKHKYYYPDISQSKMSHLESILVKNGWIKSKIF